MDEKEKETSKYGWTEICSIFEQVDCLLVLLLLFVSCIDVHS